MRVAALLVLGLAFATRAGADGVKTTVTTVCAGCHSEDGNSKVPMFPKLAGLQTEYIGKQLRDFMSGKRKNEVMAPIVANLKPEDIPPLAEYFSSQKAEPGTVADPSLAVEGRRVFMDGNENTGVPACAGCHRPDGSGTSVYPRLAGQHADYIVQQLKNFNSGGRANDPNRFMRVIAQRMTEQEMKAVAEYISGLPQQQ
jgi:cytochrome c553